jgi:hypothetical protein
MDDPVAYRSKVRIERVKGPLRRAYLPAEDKPTLFGVHSEIAKHYGVDPQVHAPPPGDSPAPLGARWRRAGSRPARGG